MKRWLLAFIAASLLGVATLVWFWPAKMLAPGPLIPAHSTVAGLSNNCFACHAPFQGATADRCTTCHAVSDIGLRTTAGKPVIRTKSLPPFHQALFSNNCMACHTDHPKPTLVPVHSHAFAHAMLAPGAGSDCASCHVPPKDTLHPDPKAGCSSCHNQVDWSAATMDHTRFFDLSRPHDASCKTCHANGDFKVFTCFGCHEHQQADMISEHLEEGIRNIDNCVACHRGADDGEGEGEGEDHE